MAEARRSSNDISHPSPADVPQAWEHFVWDNGRSGIEPRDAEPMMAREAEMAGDLPRIVASQPHSAASYPPDDPPDGHEEWRRQFISALRDVDDDAPIPATVRTAVAPTLRADDRRAPERRQQKPESRVPERRVMLKPLVAPRKIGRAVAGGAAAFAIFSTGALWATYQPDAPGNGDLQTASIAAVVSKAPAEQHMVNTPFLVREGEAAPPPPLPDTSAWRRPPATAAVPPAPRPDASKPVSPLIINRSVTVLSLPAPGVSPLARPDHGSADAVAQAPSGTPSPDRAGLTHLTTRTVPLPTPERHDPAHTGPAAASKAPSRHASPSAPARHDRQATVEPDQSQAPITTQSTSKPKWERRQGLRTAPQPEPEPSTLKKLLTTVWPGSPATTASTPAKAAAPSAPTPPAAPPHDWASKASADP